MKPRQTNQKLQKKVRERKTADRLQEYAFITRSIRRTAATGRRSPVPMSADRTVSG